MVAAELGAAEKVVDDDGLVGAGAAGARACTADATGAAT